MVTTKKQTLESYSEAVAHMGETNVQAMERFLGEWAYTEPLIDKYLAEIRYAGCTTFSIARQHLTGNDEMCLSFMKSSLRFIIDMHQFTGMPVWEITYDFKRRLGANPVHGNTTRQEAVAF